MVHNINFCFVASVYRSTASYLDSHRYPGTIRGETQEAQAMSYADWSQEDYNQFHDSAFIEIFNQLDLGYLTNEQVEEAEELFEAGWLNFEISEDERQSYRLDFQNLINYEFSSEDWQTFRELYDETNG